jgi:hypothetical protein
VGKINTGYLLGLFFARHHNTDNLLGLFGTKNIYSLLTGYLNETRWKALISSVTKWSFFGLRYNSPPTPSRPAPQQKIAEEEEQRQRVHTIPPRGFGFSEQTNPTLPHADRRIADIILESQHRSLS